jgi:integrase
MANKNLTKSSVEALAYRTDGPSRQFRWDAKVRGFGVRVTPENGKQYIILYRIQGKQKLMSLGPLHHFQNLDEARTRAGDLLNGLRKDGTDPMAERERIAEQETMSELWVTYQRDHLDHKSVNTQKSFRSTWTRHTEKEIGNLSPSQVDTGDVNRIHRRATQNGGKIVANRTVERLRTILQWLFENNKKQFPVGWINPALRIALHKESPRKAILDLDQQRSLLDSLANEPDPWMRAYIQILLLTGLRANELASLKWSTVDLEKRTAAIDDRKNGLDLDITLAPVVVEILRSLPVVANSPYVFPSSRTENHLTTNAIRHKYKAALKRAGLPHRTFHDLRRSYGTNQARDGVSTKQIASLLGNTAEITARVYTQISANDLRALTDANAAKLLPAGLLPAAQVSP